MELDLHDTSTAQTLTKVVTEFANLTWWFWVKAGMGFTLGAGIVTVSVAIIWSFVWLGGLFALGRALAH
jgi:hypothetical protein